MKKIFIFAVATALVLSFCACESKEERALREAEEAAEHANEAYQRAVDNYNQTQRDIENYKRAVDRVNTAD